VTPVQTIAAKLDLVTERIRSAERKAGRPAGSAELVAVSKNHPPEVIREAVEAGQTLFGENRVQEAAVKIPLLPSSLQWHFLGHPQSNKVRKMLPLFGLIHGVDSLGIARDIDRIASETGAFPRVLLEVNVAGESTKHGFAPQELEGCLDELLSLPRIQVEGFMTMAPLAADPEASRPFFASLREFRDRCAVRAGIPLPVLSMGMSGDFQVGVEEGATLVRVGTAIFGGR